MSFASTLPSALLETILGQLALLFLIGADGNINAARDAASRMLAACHPETEDELRLASEVISFSLHALEALGQAADPNLSINQKLRLRGSAVSLSRESHKSRRKFDQLQKARRNGSVAQPGPAAPEQEPIRPKVEKALQLVEETREAKSAAPQTAPQTWTQLYQQRQVAKRLADKQKKHHAATIAHRTTDVTIPAAMIPGYGNKIIGQPPARQPAPVPPAHPALAR